MTEPDQARSPYSIMGGEEGLLLMQLQSNFYKTADHMINTDPTQTEQKP